MTNKLSEILLHKRQEVDVLKQQLMQEPGHDIARLLRGEGGIVRARKSFKQTLLYADVVKIIAEIKRRSPSKGMLAEIADPVALARYYVAGGAAAISVLTDRYGFGGSLEDLQDVARALAGTAIPILRKDFLIDPTQIAEAMVYGADAVLLIVAVLGDRLPLMLETAKRLNIDALVEVHTADEMAQAVAAGAQIIGVNNRNLSTLQVDTQCAFDLAKYLPKECITVAESGIATMELARRYHQAGYAAVLVGEALVKSTTPSAWIGECR